MLNTAPFSSLAGNVWIEIDAGNTVSGTLQLIDMGTINFEFDLMPSDQTVVSIGGMPGATTVVFDDYISNRASLYSTLMATLGTYDPFQTSIPPKAKATLYLQPRGEAFQYRFPFEFEAVDLSTDLRSKTTTIDLSPRSSNLNVGTWVGGTSTNNFPTRISYETNQTFYVNAWASGDFIYDVVSELDTLAGNSTIYESANIEAATGGGVNTIFAFERLEDILTSPGNIFASDYSSLMFVHDTPMYFANSNSVYEKVQAFAGMEGAIFGSAFNVNFYINRRSNTYNIMVTSDDIENLRFIPQPRDLSAVTVSFVNTRATDTENVFITDGFPKITNSTGGVAGWLAGSRQLSTSISGFYPQLNRGVYDSTDNFVNGDVTTFFTFNDQELAGIASDAYSQAGGVKSVFKVQFDLFGVEKIKPYEVIAFDATFPTIYQSKYFRPTSLSYDLKADKVSVEAYQIGAAPTPTPITTTTTTTTTSAPTTTTTLPTVYSYTIFGTDGTNFSGWDTDTEACGGAMQVSMTVYSTSATFQNTMVLYKEPGLVNKLNPQKEYFAYVNVGVRSSFRVQANLTGVVSLLEACPTTTTTAAPTTTTTEAPVTTTTTAAQIYDFQIIHDGLNFVPPAVPFDNVNDACAGTNLIEVYSTSSAIAIGVDLYEDFALTTPIPIGYYAFSGNYIEINPAGNVSDYATCPETTTTTSTIPIVYTFGCYGTSASPVDGFGSDTDACAGTGEVAVDLYSYSSILDDGIELYTDSVHPLTNKLSPDQIWFAYVDGGLVRNSFRVVANGTGIVSLYEACPATTTTTTAAPTTTTTTTTTTAAPRFQIDAAYDASSDATACSDYPFALITIYGDGAGLAASSILYAASTGSTLASAGYYTDDGINVYYWDGTSTLSFFGTC